MRSRKIERVEKTLHEESKQDQSLENTSEDISALLALMCSFLIIGRKMRNAETPSYEKVVTESGSQAETLNNFFRFSQENSSSESSNNL